MQKDAAMTISPRQAVNQIPFVESFFLTKKRGSRRSGSKMPAVAAPDSVSVKTTVTWYVPLGVAEEVAIVTVLLVAE
jgi:hypothetical protein